MTIFGNQSFDELVASINRNVEQVDETEVQTKEIVDESQQRTEEYRVDTNVFEKDQTQGNSQLGLSSQVQEASKGNPFFGETSQPEVAKVESSTTTPANNPFFGTATSTGTPASTASTTNPFFGTTTSSTTPSKDTASQDETKNTATVWNPGGTTPSKPKQVKQAKPAATKQPSETKASTTVTPEQLNHVTADPTSLDAKTIDAIAEAVVDKLQERLSK
jgi:hypothetical protein